MKRFPLLRLLPLVALVFAVACTDATAPANSHALLSPKDPTLGVLGDPPPPPVDAAINVTVSSHTIRGVFNGVYFANGTSIAATAASMELGDESLGFLGTAWLRLDNKQPDPFGTSASANARFKTSNDKLFGMGTLVINGVTIRIDEVTSFRANPSCGLPGELCAVITFNATVNGETGHTGTAEAFDRAFCTIVFVRGDGEGQEGHFVYSCPPAGS